MVRVGLVVPLPYALEQLADSSNQEQLAVSNCGHRSSLMAFIIFQPCQRKVFERPTSLAHYFGFLKMTWWA